MRQFCISSLHDLDDLFPEEFPEDDSELHWIYDHGQAQVRVFTNEDIRYGGFDVISPEEFQRIIVSGTYKGKEVSLDQDEYKEKE